MAPMGGDLQGAIAATRFGLGARPGEIEAATADPKGWLLAQIRPEGADQPEGDFPNSRKRLQELYAYREERRADMAPAAMDAGMADKAAEGRADMFKAAQQELRQEIGTEFLARARLATDTPASFRERWTLFWADHFTVSAVKLQTAIVVGAFEREAIRPNVFGRFEDLLVASSRHPAMLLYLDQTQSFGPDSQFGRRRQLGLNENLAREILELHTVGVDAGYTQADVTEFARALTGWSIGGPREYPESRGIYLYRAGGHQPGVRTIMGRSYPDRGEEQARAVLRDLAAAPRTARHVCRKLAAHFVADDPPPRLVERLTAAWTGSHGRLDAVARALIEAPEAWDPAPLKLKTPYEFIVSGYRACGVRPTAIEKLAPILTALGQKPFSAPSPKGWPVEAAAWAAPDAVVKRLEWAKGFSAVVAPHIEPVGIAKGALGSRLGERSAQAVARAESRTEALALLLMSPEFQRR